MEERAIKRIWNLNFEVVLQFWDLYSKGSNICMNINHLCMIVICLNIKTMDK